MYFIKKNTFYILQNLFNKKVVIWGKTLKTNILQIYYVRTVHISIKCASNKQHLNPGNTIAGLWNTDLRSLFNNLICSPYLLKYGTKHSPKLLEGEQTYINLLSTT